MATPAYKQSSISRLAIITGQPYGCVYHNTVSQAEDDEEMDLMDDALLMRDQLEQDSSMGSEGMLDDSKQAQPLDYLLEGTLPGVTKDWAAGGDFARDILGDMDEMSDAEEE